MSQTKHTAGPNTDVADSFTPGPWHISKSLGRYEIWPKDYGHTHCFVGVVQRQIDARLIAAAPDLLEACRALTAEVPLWELNIRKDFSLINAHNCALKAIAKAEGAL